MLRWLVLDLNNFFASCEQQENPHLRGKPVIVVPTIAETTCAIAASYPVRGNARHRHAAACAAGHLATSAKLEALWVGIALTGLAAQEAHQVDLFDKPRNARLVRAVDLVNEKFGKGALFYGDAAPRQSSKIAFQRVPKVEEF